MALQTTAISIEWLSSDDVRTPTNTNEKMAQLQRNSFFCAVRAECYNKDKLMRSQLVDIVSGVSE
jgi:hypothetical protein